MNTFAVSDEHFEHSNIVKYSNRPFVTSCKAHPDLDWTKVEKPDEPCVDCKEETKNVQTQELIKRRNAVVGENDLVYNLGDFIWTKDPLEWAMIVHHLNGKQRIIVGNHDGLIADKNGCAKNVDELPDEIRALVRSGKIEWIKNYYEAKMCGGYYIFHHFPLSSFHRAMYGSSHLHGHTHGTNPTSWPQSTKHGRTLDAGVDCHGYAPVSFDDVKIILDSCTNENAHRFEN